jgi:peptide/nickel transport system substrate-binding protein
MRALARLALAAAGFLVVFGLATTVVITTTTETVPARGGLYVEALAGQPGRLNPLAAPSNPPDSDIAALVFSGLTRRDEQGHLAPDLASSWQASTDGRVYTFTLRADARWHDSAPVTAADVVYTVQATQSENLDVAPWIRQFWRDIVAERISDQVVRLSLEKPFAPFLQYTTLGLLPAHLLAGGDDASREAYDDRPIGSGPYRFVERTGRRTTIEAVFQSGDGAPMIPRLEFRYYADTSAALDALRAGEVMAVAGVSPQQERTLSNTSGISVYWTRQASQAIVMFNLSLPFFEDAATRRALVAAIDRQAIVNNVLDGQGIVPLGPYLSDSWASQAAAASVSNTRTQAALLLEQAGWRDDNRDGVRERNGVPLQFSLLTNDDPTRIAVAQAIATAWTELGAALEVQIINSAGLVQDYLEPRRFEAVLFGWSNLPDDPDPYEMWHSSQTAPAGLNFTGFASQRADEILEQARQTSDRPTRQELYARFADMLGELAPAFVVYEPSYGIAMSSQVKQARFSLVGEPGDRFRHLAEWYTLTRDITATDTRRVR